ncbi:hypothetical protein BH762_gp026 [Gordonia phage OneUp]|uniref:Uncharacterized protein n=1 Tax=Gordonia phage OneUp TaxID=1838074 RepID=A0A160DF43_9CAUD|nr:hypothetical protein BH762_gp026 [Gordonia phage OneUp]ANA86492.1 hypothetical protein PBI_ONEUP_159 [Gordonia phage OneUp]
MSNYIVTWEIDDEDTGSPIDAAIAALNVIRGTFVGDPDGANVFTVTDVDAGGVKYLVDLGNMSMEEIQ